MTATEITKINSAPEGVTCVFQPGKLAVETPPVQHGDDVPTTPPIPVLVVAPRDAGTYPVVVFLHGFLLQNKNYERLLRHVASHGFIIVAPQMHYTVFSFLPTCDNEDIGAAAKVVDWLPKGLPGVLPDGVKPELSKLALAGHSRGGHTAFSLALGYAKTKLSFSAVIGLDPVAGTSKSSQLQLPPKILAGDKPSFDMAGSMPVLVIGTGLGERRKYLFLPPGAPKDVNHREFYRRCKPPCYYFVAKDYGHVDMLDDGPLEFISHICESGNGCKDKMRRCIAGIMVAFLNTALLGHGEDLEVMLRDPPIRLDPAKYTPHDQLQPKKRAQQPVFPEEKSKRRKTIK